jgi:hypothetical protein
VPTSGTYQLEVWGTQGSPVYGGKGGYASGEVYLTAGTTLYVYVGGMSGFNGGGGSGYVLTATSYKPGGYLLDSSYYMSNIELIAGSITITEPDGTTQTGHSGDGYARITYIGSE